MRRQELKKPQLLTETHHSLLALQEVSLDEEGLDKLEDEDSKDGDKIHPWRVRDRMKTSSVALVLCLNIGVDPPDVVKPDPCARMECWVDPLSLPPPKALDLIGKSLQGQYERWQPRARYKTCPDPTVEEVKKLCISLRRTAKDERVLFHYNGHGVPKPTKNGEIWVFNKNYTQYIPLSIYDLQTWMDTPSIYVFDCSAAGLIATSFKQFALQRQHEKEQALNSRPFAMSAAAAFYPEKMDESSKEYILLVACGENELLPTNPDYPADLFTSCLTTPIKTALQWFAPRSLLQGITLDMIDSIPGSLNDRRTVLGELNWIFTAITDTIAWNVFPRSLFKKLFRQDLLVASLFRNFLLAERIMRTANCTPFTEPRLPPTYNHPLWQAWDYSVEHCLAQIPGLLAAEAVANSRAMKSQGSYGGQGIAIHENGVQNGGFQYVCNPFFEDQMTAFEVWLAVGPDERSAPEQLPIVLQVLLSQAHRLRALRLLAKFLQTGPWAVDLALSVGIFPYVLKLLQSPAQDLRQELVFIWGKILALDNSCETDLTKENGYVYFVEFLSNVNATAVCLSMAFFVLTIVAENVPNRMHEIGVVGACIPKLEHPSSLVRRWACLCLGRIAQNSQICALDMLKNSILVSSVTKIAQSDSCSIVRAAALFSLGALVEHFIIAPPGEESQHFENPEAQPNAPAIISQSYERSQGYGQSAASEVYCSPMTFAPTSNMPVQSQVQGEAPKAPPMRPEPKDVMIILSVLDTVISTFVICYDSESSPLVRREIVTCFSNIAKMHLNEFLEMLCCDEVETERDTGFSEEQKAYRDLLLLIWNLLVQLGEDPHPWICTYAYEATDAVMRNLDAKMKQKITRSRDIRTEEEVMHLVPGIVKGASFPRNIGQTSQSTAATANPSVSARFVEKEDKDKGRSFSLNALISNVRKLTGQPEAPKSPAQNIVNTIYKTNEPQTLYEWSCNGIIELQYDLIEDFTDKNVRIRKDDVFSNKIKPYRGGNETDNISMTEEQASKYCTLIHEVDSHNMRNGEIWSLSFLPANQGIIVGDSLGNVSIWDYLKWEQRATFTVPSASLGELPGITSLCVMDDSSYDPLIVAGSAAGNVALWRKKQGENEPNRIISTWRASGGTFGRRNPLGGYGLILHPIQSKNHLIAGGCEGGVVRNWDISNEKCVWHCDILKKNSAVTALFYGDFGLGPLLTVAGTNGSIALVDTRILPIGGSSGEQDSGTMSRGILSLEEHKSGIVSLSRISNGDNVNLISGDLNGEIKSWDLRLAGRGSMMTIAAHKNEMTAMVCRDQVPLITSGSSMGSLKFYGTDGSLKKHIQYHEGFLSTRLGPITSLAFHPTANILAVGAADSLLSIYQ